MNNKPSKAHSGNSRYPWSQLKSVIKKECLDARRDGKSLATTFLMPILFAAMTLGSLFFFVSMQEGSQDFSLPVKGGEHAPELVQWLEESGITVVVAPEDIHQSILQQEWDAVLQIPSTFGQHFRQQRSASVLLFADQSRTSSQAKIGRIRELVQHWSATTGALRLIARNVSPEIAHPIKISEVNVSSDERLAAKVLSGLPLIIMLIAFVSGIGMSSDMAAGERERRSLEPLLINPVSHSTLIWGKCLAGVLVSIAISAIGVGMQFISIQFAPLAELGLSIELGFAEYITILLLLVPNIFLAVAIQLLVSFAAKSFKDAQSYNSLVTLLPMIPGLYIIFNSGAAETWQMLIPVLGPQVLLVDIISGDGLSLIHGVLASLVAVALGLVTLSLGVAQLKREAILSHHN